MDGSPPIRPRAPGPTGVAVAILLGTMLLVPCAAALLVHAFLPAFPALPSFPARSSASLVAKPAEDGTPGIRGRVLNAEGDAVEGAAVRVVSVRQPSAVLRETRSDASGKFFFPRVDAGRVRLVADHDPDGAVSSEVVEADPGRSTEITLVLSPGGAIRGTVVDAEDHPVAGSTLGVEGVPWNISGATSDDTGAFLLRAVPREATALVATARGFDTARISLGPRDEHAELVVRVRLQAARSVGGDVLDVDGKPTSARIVACEGEPFEARTTSAADGTFQLPSTTVGCSAVAQHDEYADSSAAPVTGGRRVVLRLKPGGAIEGAVVDERGAAVPSFGVGIESFLAAHGRSTRSVAPRSFEDPRGVFLLERLAPGSYVLIGTASGKPPTRSASVDVRGGTVTRGVRIVLPEGGSVMGHVYDDRHLPLADVDLRFDLVSSVVESKAEAKTDQRGQYRLDGAPAGLFTLRVQKDGFRLRLVSGLRVDSRATLRQDVTLTAGLGGASLELTGIGASIKQTGSGVSVASVFAGDPAEHAGLRAGDLILSVDGESTDGMSSADVIQRLRGQQGASVGVTAQRPATGETVDVLIERGIIVH